ncbi:dolichyl-phosphate-mannose--protein mannosyltransferase [Actinacidiphila paucisporea]|uniref:Polyprenol-phosphate-mannose--protein mannosyltransferase n=1 Tax=Actinacidiphila paucisporea TaxID=310782 RepID=A0A1M7EZX5_9ACTN|nr:Dolichyl-phosphate-mannose-protein mannosyltransferase [Actinacidiphila paucisporea]
MTSETATQDRAAEAVLAQLHPSPWAQRLRRFGYAERPRTDTRERLVPPFPEPGTRMWRSLGASQELSYLLARISGWLGPILVAVFAGALRFWHLGTPREVVFDETYYAKDAWSLLQFGYEGTWPDAKITNPDLLGHPQTIPLSDAPGYVVHPPAGKWVIALGEWMFGMNPFGWRFMMAVLGTLAVLMLCRIGRRLFRSTALGCLAGVLMSVDGLEFVMSRIALLDLVIMFFALAAFGCLLVDRDWSRARLARALPVDGSGWAGPDRQVGERVGMGWRPWRIAAAVFLGLAAASKWNGFYFLAFFVVMTLAWDIGARRVAGARRPWLAMLRKDFGWSVLTMIPVTLLTYLATWTGWFMSDKAYNRHWADGRSGTWSWIPGPLRSLWHYEYEVYQFNVTLHTPHPYQSNPWSWLVLGRPVSYYFESPKLGQDGCHSAGGCSKEILALGTPLLWWSACFALLYLLYRWIMRRDWRAGAVLGALGAGLLPWFHYQDRTIFYFYAVAFVPYLCLAVAMMVGAFLGPPGSGEGRRMWGAVGAGTLVLLIIWNFIYFFPIYTGTTIPYTGWQARMWFDSWV